MEARKIGNGWAMQEFWEMRKWIFSELKFAMALSVDISSGKGSERLADLIDKIESLESKYEGGE